MAAGSLTALVCATSLSAASATVHADTWSAGVSVDRVAWLASVAWFGSKGHGVWVRRSLPHDLSIGLDGRVLSTPLLVDGRAFELGGSFGYAPGTGAYRPRVALTGGWSGGVFFDWAAYHGEGWQEQDPVGRADYRPWYAGVSVEPLGFAWGRVAGSALGVEVDQQGWARVVRARVHFARLGVAW